MALHVRCPSPGCSHVFDIDSEQAAQEARCPKCQQAVPVPHPERDTPLDLRKDTGIVYGSSGYGDACLLARRLVEVGLPFAEVSLPEWDNHSGFAYHKQNLPPLDAALSGLILDLKDRGLLDQTLIVVMGEFGRGGTGRVGPDAKSKEDRGHWHRAWSTALIGGGIKGGQVIGKTDKIAATVEERPVSIADFFATICTVLGVNYTKEYNEPGRPIRIVDKGEKPLTELL